MIFAIELGMLDVGAWFITPLHLPPHPSLVNGSLFWLSLGNHSTLLAGKNSDILVNAPLRIQGERQRRRLYLVCLGNTHNGCTNSKVLDDMRSPTVTALVNTCPDDAMRL